MSFCGATVEVRHLGEIARIERDAVTAEAIKNGTTYVGLENIDSDGQFVGVRHVSAGELASNKFRFGPRHILFGKLRPYLRKTARPHFLGVCSTDILPILPGPHVDRDYLFHFLRHPTTVARAVARCAGANLPRVSPGDLARFGVPVPPLPEQRRIAAILDKADTIRRKRQESIGLTDQLLRSIFLEMFGDPVTNPKRWPMSSFGEHLAAMQYGPRFYNEAYSANGVRIVRITDLDSHGNLDFELMPQMEVSPEEMGQHALRAGDLIFARTGATVGKTAVIREGDPPCIAGAYFIRMSFKPPVLSQYARMVLASDSIQAIIEKRSRQSAQQNFSGPGIRSLPLPVPPLELQARFDSVEARVVATGRTLKAYVERSNYLFNSLVQGVFCGE